MGKEPTFTGVWIPAEIMLDTELKAADKILYAEIACFGTNGCYKKSEELMDRIGLKKDAFRASMHRLVDAGYIEEQKLKNGRVLRMSTLCFGKVFHMPKSEKPTMPKSEKPTMHIRIQNKNTHTLISKDIKGADAQAVEKSEEYGDPNINELFDYWKEKTSLPITSKVKMNRNACHTLLKHYGMSKLKGLIRIVAIAQEKPYAPSVGDFIKLQEKQNDLLIWYKKERKNIAALRAVTSPVSDFKAKDANSSSLKAAKAIQRELEAKSDNSDDFKKLSKEQLEALRDRALKNLEEKA